MEDYHLLELGVNIQRVPKIAHFDDSNRILQNGAPRDAYVPPVKPSTLPHWGQLKLMMSEIEFLTKYGHLANLVVYAGAAGGYHIPYLSVMFPRIVFHLYDPSEFAIQPNNRIHIFNEYMTDEVASKYSPTSLGSAVLLISDIRLESPEKETGDERADTAKRTKYAKAISTDNAMQLSWSQKMEAVASMVKFKTPYGLVDGKSYSMYPKGEVHLPIWGKHLTTETRLMYLDPNDLIKYDHRSHEERMYYWNKHEMLYHYEHDYSGDFTPNGIDHCYYCRAHLHVLEQYVKKIYAITDSGMVRSLVKNFSERITLEISKATSAYIGKEVNYTLQSQSDEQIRKYKQAVAKLPKA
jgi:hypothetical protein